MSTQVRQRIERELAEETIKVILAVSPTYSISVDDGDNGWLIEQSREPEAILKEMFSMDDDGLYVYDSADTKRRQPFAWVRFIYGNCGHDAIHDHTMNLEATLKPVFELADRLEKEFGDQ